MKYFVYESPKKEKRRSRPVAENDLKTRTQLESMRWRIVEEIGADEGEEPRSEQEFEAAPMPPFFSELLGLTSLQAEALLAAGYNTPEALAEADDEDLLAVDRIGPATVEKIREALAE
jgi:DNA-directed RNA polymerase alpha subunit